MPDAASICGEHGSLQVLSAVKEQSFSCHPSGREQWQTGPKTAGWASNPKLEADGRMWSVWQLFPSSWDQVKTWGHCAWEGLLGREELLQDYALNHEQPKKWLIHCNQEAFYRSPSSLSYFGKPHKPLGDTNEANDYRTHPGKTFRILIRENGLDSACFFFFFSHLLLATNFATKLWLIPWCLHVVILCQ